jgi:hypothetical protein
MARPPVLHCQAVAVVVEIIEAEREREASPNLH